GGCSPNHILPPLYSSFLWATALHAIFFFFFRTNILSAPPAQTGDPANPDPFFQRRQFGFAAGGPIHRNRLFFFGNWERNEQRGVASTTLAGPDFSHFTRITPSPLFGNQLTLRLDGRVSNAHTAFLRYSHEGSSVFGPVTGLPNTSPNSYPSNWTRQVVCATRISWGSSAHCAPRWSTNFAFPTSSSA